MVIFSFVSLMEENLLRSAEATKTKAGEVVYSDSRVLTVDGTI